MGLWRNPVWVIGGYMRILLKKSEIDRLVNTGCTETYVKIPVDADRIIRISCEVMEGFPDIEHEDRKTNGNICNVEMKTICNPFADLERRLVHAVCKRRRKHGVTKVSAEVVSCIPIVNQESNVAYWKIKLKRCER